MCVAFLVVEHKPRLESGGQLIDSRLETVAVNGVVEVQVGIAQLHTTGFSLFRPVCGFLPRRFGNHLVVNVHEHDSHGYEMQPSGK